MNAQSDFIIGVMDSGLGGLSVLNALTQEVRYADYIYYGDMENSPYGPKPTKEVERHVRNAVSVLLEKGANAVLLACNTATSAAAENLRKELSVPVFGMEPAIKPALTENPNEKIGVLATSLTLREDKFQTLGETLSASEKIHPINCDGLATLIDRGDFPEIMNFLTGIFSNLNENKIQNIVLGCTHYVLMEPVFRKERPDLNIYHGNSGTVRHIKNTLNLPDAEREPKLDLYLNGGSEEDFELAFNYLNSSAEKETRYVK